MVIVEPSVKLLESTPFPIQLIAKAARVCYQSQEHSSRPDEEMVRMILKNGHESVIEHASATIAIVCDRGVTHEIVRHRLCSYSQESTRYCNYSSKKFGAEIKVIQPPDLHGKTLEIWKQTVLACEIAYIELIANGVKPQIARAILPNCLKTEIVMTCNFREWRHFLKLRCAPAAHPQMQEIANMVRVVLQECCPIVFEELPT